MNKVMVKKMKHKIIFWIPHLKLFCLSKFLQEKIDCQLYAIFDVWKDHRDFINSQKITEFKKIWHYSENVKIENKEFDERYLKDFEKRTGINLWDIAFAEKSFYRFNKFHDWKSDEILRILYQECKFFENVLDETKPDFIIMDRTDYHHMNLFYNIAKSKGVKILMLLDTRILDRWRISENKNSWEVLKDRKENLSELTSEQVQNYFEKHDYYTKTIDWMKPIYVSPYERFLEFLKFFLLTNFKEYQNHYKFYGRTRLKILKKGIFTKLNNIYMQKQIKKKSINKINEYQPFVYIPLHTEPESTLQIDNPMLTNQLELIKKVSKSIPIDHEIYVKEHPTIAAKGFRPLSFYNEIIELPNVKLLSPQIPVKTILSKCSLVLTIMGTTALEAILYEKPSIVFSDIEFSSIPYITRIESFDELSETIKNGLNINISVQKLSDYINFVNENSFEIDLIDLEKALFFQFYYWNFIPTAKKFKEKELLKFIEKTNKVWDLLSDKFIERINDHEQKKIISIKK
jgi:hypothetical protein